MIDDIERRLRQVIPRGAPDELRTRVLAAVDHELRSTPPLPSSRRPVLLLLAVAAVLVASVSLNVWVSDLVDRRVASLLGPRPVDKRAAEIADDVASITDPATGRWAYRQLVSGQFVGGEDAREYAVRLQRSIQQYHADFKEKTNEALRKSRQVDGDRRGNRDRHPPGAQCLYRLEHRNHA